MPSCLIPTNEGMYGFGIRLSFYINWVAIIMADYVFTPSHSVRERAVTFLLEVAVFIALAKHSRDKTITGVEAYLCSLLISTTLLFHMPAMTWRVICGCRDRCDLYLGVRWRNWTTATRDFLTAMRAFYLVALCIWEFWFWSLGLRSLAEARDPYCSRFGFGFRSWRLDNRGLEIFHLIVYSLLLAGLLYAVWEGMYNRDGEVERAKKRRRWRRRMKREPLNDNASLLHFIRAFLHMVVVVTTIVAVELVIRWNHIVDAYSVTTSAQIFPLLLSISKVVRVMWHQMKMTQNDVDVESASESSFERGRSRERGGWPEPVHGGPRLANWITTD